MAVKDWSTTAASNTAFLAGISTDGAVMTVNQTDNAFREMAAQIASQLGKLGFKGADIASATTTNLANATGWYIHVTGTTTITGFGTVDAGQPALIRFAGALTLTHNATSLILPGAANITTAANDVAFMMSLGSGNWQCISYSRASGVPLGYPTSSTDNTLPRFNGTSGALQTSGVVVDDSNNVSGVGTLASGAITSSGAIAGTTYTASGNNYVGGASAVALAPGGAGTVLLRPGGIAVSTGQVSIASTGNVTVNGDLTATGTITASSDRRLKKNIRPIKGALGIVKELRGVRFTRRKVNTKSIGLIAQEVEKILPELVHEQDGMKSVAYGNIVAVLIEAVKELAAKVEAK